MTYLYQRLLLRVVPDSLVPADFLNDCLYNFKVRHFHYGYYSGTFKNCTKKHKFQLALSAILNMDSDVLGLN